MEHSKNLMLAILMKFTFIEAILTFYEINEAVLSPMINLLIVALMSLAIDYIRFLSKKIKDASNNSTSNNSSNRPNGF